jgi:glyceraldehyde 3-phosphate dehydrogenase
MKVAINGLGRIGRATLKQLLEYPALTLVAANDLVPADNIAYLLNYDTVYGRYSKTVEADTDGLRVDGQKIDLFNEMDPEKLPWEKLQVELVFECTGIFNKKEDLLKHLRAGAKMAILSAPAKDEETATVVYGVNHSKNRAVDVVSCASCTTNCITPVVEVMHRRIGIKKATMTTIHAYTSTQAVVDSPNKKMRRGRAGAANFVPTSTGAAKATAKALPEMQGKFDGVAVRGPIPVGSLADLVFITERETSVEEINTVFEEEARSERYRGILGATRDPIVSSDIIGQKYASIVDLGMTQVVDGDLIKVMSWYDNEWGYAHQMIREALYLSAQS